MSETKCPKTVFIVGAGSSCHLGYPTGAQLIEKIMSGGAPHPLRDESFIKQLKLAQSPSIDNFLKSHEKNEHYLKIGKALIFWYIFKCESEQSVAEIRTGDWYTAFVNAVESMMREGSGSFEQFDMISFNYDRSLEYTLASRLLHRGHARHMKAALEMIGASRFIHMYDRLPETPDEYFARTQENVLPQQYLAPGYGARNQLGSDEDWRAENCLRWGPGFIKTFFEATDETIKAKSVIENADHVVFLGFGFHPQNMNALGFDFSDAKACAGKTIIGTSLGMSATDRARINASYNDNIELFPVNCLDLLKEHFVIGNRFPVVGGRVR